MQNAVGIAEICTKFGSEDLKGRDHLENFSLDGNIILNWILNGMWTQFIWLKIVTSGVLIRINTVMTFGFYERQ
jgi:hypothetical protein